MTQDEALRMALEALEKIASSDYRGNRSNESVIAFKTLTAIKEALAQPEQKPVACVQDLDEVKRKHLVYEKGMDWKDPLYTTPPQRTWVGLTDEEIDQGLLRSDYAFKTAEAWRAGVVFAMTKLKEKNT